MDIHAFVQELSNLPELSGYRIEVPSWSDVYMGGRDRIIIFSKDGKEACTITPDFRIFGLVKYIGTTNRQMQKELGIHITFDSIRSMFTDGKTRLTIAGKVWKLSLKKRSKNEEGHRWTIVAE